MGRPGSVAGLRAALTAFAAGIPEVRAWCVGLSGGPDSLALTAAAAATLPTTALIIDHGLQPDSAAVAHTARRQALDLGCIAAQVIPVTVGNEGGPENAARTARYSALDSARGGAPVLLGHTLDDQAETVLLGLGRGSGPRSIAGMKVCDPPWYRPLLGVRRNATLSACAELGLSYWDDPHNRDARFTRVRLRREVIPLLEDVLGGGVAEALSRTAGLLRLDTDALDAMAAAFLEAATSGGVLQISEILGLDAALRRRVLRGWLLAGGAIGLTEGQIRDVDALVSDWRGQGGVAVGSSLPAARLFAVRRAATLVLRIEPVRLS